VQEESCDGFFLFFNPNLSLIFAQKTDRGFDDFHVAGNLRSCRRQNDEGLSAEFPSIGAGVEATVAENVAVVTISTFWLQTRHVAIVCRKLSDFLRGCAFFCVQSFLVVRWLDTIIFLMRHLFCC
jgi:hypothetical protein